MYTVTTPSVSSQSLATIGLASPFKPIGLAGPTASGKTGIALMLAQHIPLEIISVDSALVYRGMDIGTAKPSHAERAAVPHHLIDIIEPFESYSAAQFVKDTLAAIVDVQSRGKLPLLVGGTMLYFKALIDGLDDMPPVDPTLRPQIEQDAARLGWPALHEQLRQIDPITAARLSPNDAQRISRALEVYLSSGQPLSSFQKQRRLASHNADDVNKIHIKPTSSDDSNPLQNSSKTPLGAPDLPKANSEVLNPSPNDVNFFHINAALQSQTPTHHAEDTIHSTALRDLPLISLEPSDRAWLHQRIRERFTQMLHNGLVAEVQTLRQRGDLRLDMPSMRCVGYRQTWQLLDEGADLQTAAGQHRLLELGSAATRQLAKRQLTWLRSMDQRHVVPCDAPDAGERVLRLVQQLLAEK